LDLTPTGPHTVSKVSNENAYKFDQLYTIRKHKVFHISLLDRYTSPTAGQGPSKPRPMMIKESDEWEPDRILHGEQRYRKLHYIVQCASNSYVWTSWEPAENHVNAQELVDEFHREHLRKP
jgi:hypothetical protein